METQKLSPIRRFWLLLKPDRLEIRNLYIYATNIYLFIILCVQQIFIY